MPVHGTGRVWRLLLVGALAAASVLPAGAFGNRAALQAAVGAWVAAPAAAEAGRDTVMLCLLTGEVDAAFARAVDGGRAKVEQRPRLTPAFGIYNALLRDPDDYLVELQRFEDAAVQRAFSR